MTHQTLSGPALAAFENRKKSVGMAYLAWLFGLHYAYFGQWFKLVLYWVTLGGLFLWMLYDGLRMRKLVAQTNAQIANEIAIAAG